MGEKKPECAWPEWELGESLGKGSYGTVYEAVRKGEFGVESHAAIKVVSIPQEESTVEILRMEGMDDTAIQSELDEMAASYANEIQILCDLRGAANIVVVEDFAQIPKKDSLGWDFFIRMEKLTSLSKYLGKRSMGEQAVAKLGVDICSALEICAGKGLIHRDIKLGNLFVSEFGDFKLGDFGVARQMDGTRFEMSRQGTGAYMAPEVEKGLPYDATADLYSLGIVLYTLMNHRRQPLEDLSAEGRGERQKAILRRLNGEVLPPPSQASPQMSAVILRACAYDPRQRFASATEMKEALQEVVKGETSSSLHSDALTESPAQPKDEASFSSEPASPTAAHKNRKWIGIPLVLVAVAVIAIGTAYGVQRNRENRYEALVDQQVQYREAGDAAKETAAYEEAVSLRPSELESYYQHALTLYELRSEEGVPDYQACIDLIEKEILPNPDLDLMQSRMADIYYLYADSLFQTAQDAENIQLQEERYAMAVEAYGRLFAIGTDETQYYREYAIALAYDGQTSEAERVLSEAEELGLGSDSLSYTKGEVEQIRGEYAEALADFEQCIRLTKEENLAARARLARSDLYQALEDPEAAREELLEAKDLDSTKAPQILQDLIKVDINLATDADTGARTAAGAEAAQYEQDALFYRREAIETLHLVITNGWDRSFATYNNLVVLYQQVGDLEDAEQTLLSVEDTYGENYQWYKRYAFLEVSRQETLTQKERDYGRFAEYYQEAVSLYRVYLQNAGEADDEMSLLDLQYEEVRSKGQLQE